MLSALQHPINVITRKLACEPDVVDLIVKHHRSQTAKQLNPLPKFIPNVLSTVTMGLGDTVMLVALPRAAAQQNKNLTCFSGSPHFLYLMHFNPYWKDQTDKAFMVNAPDLVRQYDCGNGHYLQRLRRAFGLQVDDCPRGCIAWKGQRSSRKVIIHFEPGVHALWQQKEIHPQARVLYHQTKQELERFIIESSRFHFVQVGKEALGIRGAEYRPTENTFKLVNEIASASYFIGIMSGPMHVATALNLKCVVIINFPKPEKIFLPTLRVTDQVESEWFYPQNVHLHQDGEGPLVPKADCNNLHRAFNGEVYPFWSKSYLHLIHEPL